MAQTVFAVTVDYLKFRMRGRDPVHKHALLRSVFHFLIIDPTPAAEFHKDPVFSAEMFLHPSAGIMHGNNRFLTQSGQKRLESFLVQLHVVRGINEHKINRAAVDIVP